MIQHGYVELSAAAVLRADPEYFQSFTLFDVNSFKTYELDAAEFSLLRTVAETGLPADVYNLATRTLGNPELWEALWMAGVLRAVSESPTPVPLPKLPELLAGRLPVTSSPTELEFCITRRCNQACVHCNVSAVGLARADKLDAEFWLDLVAQAKAAGVLRITLTGGEPLVRPDIGRILTAFADRRVGLVVLSNGTQVTDALIPSIRASGAVFSISLDAAAAGVHDSFRRHPGGFAAAVEGMKRLGAAGVRFVISCVVHDMNVRDLEPVLELGQQLGAQRVIFVPMVRVGRGATQSSSSWLPNNLALSSSLGRIRNVALEKPGPDVIVGNGDTKEIVAIRDRYSGATAMSKRNPGFCKAGTFSMAVDEDGRAYSCLRGVQTKTYPIADLRQVSLLEAWRARAWSPFRDPDLTPVACRVEAIQHEQKRRLHLKVDAR